MTVHDGGRTEEPVRPSGRGRVPPGPRGGAALGKLVQVSRDRLTLLTSVTREYGDAVRIPMGPKALYVFNHPDHAKHVLTDNHANYRKGIGLIHARRALGDGLLTSEGELWRAQRRATQPAFHRDRLARAAEVIAEEMAGVLRLWRGQAGETIDVVGEMTHLTLVVLGRALLQVDIGSTDAIGHSFATVQDQAMFEMATLNMVPPWLPLPRQLRFRRARRELDALVERLVADHVRRSGGSEEGLLSRMLASARQGPAEEVQRRLRDELVTLLLAGHETTASTLGWTWYLVEQHPEVFDRIHAEAVEALGDRPPTFEDLHRLRYTSMVIEEVMRLYPPVWVLTRRAIEGDEVGGYDVPAGADVMICPYTLHRHPGFWDDPERFDPERFDPDRAGARARYSYIPFGAGPRYCVGSNLGMLEATLVVAMIAREFRLRRPSSRPVVAEPMLSLRVRDGLPMTIHPI